MAAGRPVLAIWPPSCELAETIHRHETGCVVANGEVAEARRALLYAVRNPLLLDRMGADAARLLKEKSSLAGAVSAYQRPINENKASSSSYATQVRKSPGSTRPGSSAKS
jgi:glycosyltransferase involved in cell wall biosynthesis